MVQFGEDASVVDHFRSGFPVGHVESSRVWPRKGGSDIRSGTTEELPFVLSLAQRDGLIR